MTAEPRFMQERVAKEDLWVRCLRALGPDMRLCVLHNYESLDELLESDVDCVLPARHLPTGVARRLHRAGISVVQHVQYEATAHSFILGTRTSGGDWGFLRLDIASDVRSSTKPLLTGRVFFTEAELARSQRSFGAFNVPAPDVEFGYYLSKRIAKGNLSNEHGRALSLLFLQDPAGCSRRLARFWGKRRAAQLARAASSGDWSEVRSRTAECRAELLKRSAVSAPSRLLGYWLRDVGRLTRRWLQPAGLFVVLVGADRADAAALADGVAEAVAPAFNGAIVHPQKKTVPPTGGATLSGYPRPGDPWVTATKLGRSAVLISALRAGGERVADGLWYWRRIRPVLAQVRLVVVEGGASEFSGDQVRPWFRLPLRLAPPPDLEIRVDAVPTEEAVAAISNEILEHLVERTAHRLDLAPESQRRLDGLPFDPTHHSLPSARIR